MKVELVKDGLGNIVTIAPQPTTVTFSFCTACNQWEAVVDGAKDRDEALKAVLSVISVVHHSVGVRGTDLEDNRFSFSFLIPD